MCITSLISSTRNDGVCPLEMQQDISDWKMLQTNKNWYAIPEISATIVKWIKSKKYPKYSGFSKKGFNYWYFHAKQRGLYSRLTDRFLVLSH